MKNLLILWDEPLNITWGGIHRTILCLKENLPPRGINVTYMYSKDGYRTYNHEVEANVIKTYNLIDLRKFIVENKFDIILGQEAAFSSTLTRTIKDLNLPDVKLINQYHCSLLYFDKKLNWDYLKYTWSTDKSISSRIGVFLRGALYPLWRYHVKHTQNKIYKYNYENSNISVLLSENEKPILAKITSDELLTKCFAIPNPLSWDKIESPQILQNKKKEVLIVSRIYNIEKRIDLALKVWKLLESRGRNDGWLLRIVGDGIDKEYLMSMATKLNIKNVVWESRQDPKPLYEKASIFLLTSIAEGWALTLTESMQNGVVPIAFDSYPAVRNIITDGHDGFLVPTKNIKMYADKLEELMNNQTVREQMALNGLISSQRFTIDKVIDKWVDMINSL